MLFKELGFFARQEWGKPKPYLEMMSSNLGDSRGKMREASWVWCEPVTPSGPAVVDNDVGKW